MPALNFGLVGKDPYYYIFTFLKAVFRSGIRVGIVKTMAVSMPLYFE